MHLAIASTIWFTSRAAWPDWKGGSPASRPASPPSPPAPPPLADALRAVDPDAFAGALDRELRRRADRFLAGIEAYRHHPYRRRADPVRVVWTEGTTRVLAYGTPGAGGTAVLVVPSLVNRFHILDLDPEVSFLRHLAAAGLRPYVVDWDRPGAAERGFDLTAYVAGRLEGALDAVVAETGGAVAVLGYCMGGDLALALALRRPRAVTRLALLATPWDFHGQQAARARLVAAWAGATAPWLYAWGELPVDLLQSLFLALDPTLALRKFSAFADLDPDSPRARLFVALEDWLNDGVPLAAPVARACLADWYGANATAAGHWRIAGRPVRPGALRLPALVVVPEKDRIVPAASARALAEAIPGAATMTPALGHIGMIVGTGARQAVWEPVRRWLDSPRTAS